MSGTLGLAAMIALVAVLYPAGTRLSARRARASDHLPLVVAMVAFIVGGLGLLFGL